MANQIFNVTVIIPVYNAEKYVTTAVESSLQFPEVREVLLIEDGSPDNALEVCKDLERKDTRVKLFQHPDKGNHGAGASRNLGLANVSCPYLAFLDADDFFLPNRFDTDKKTFMDIPDADGVYNAIGVYYYSEDAEKIYKNLPRQELTTITEYMDSMTLFESYIGLRKWPGYFHIDGLTIKKMAIEKMNYCFNPRLRLHQDTEFLIRLAYTTKLVPGEIKMPTAKRGIHGKNRITEIQFDKKNKNQHQKKLWFSLYDWAERKKIPAKYTQQINKRKVKYCLLTYSYFYKWFFMLWQIAKDKSLLTDIVYYNSIHHLIFGNSKLASWILKVKNKIHSKLMCR
jgi:glycosyltransferase involved in cell wall biosynthesis